MRTTTLTFVLAALFTGLAFGQNPAEENLDRTLHFTHTEKAQDLQEIATLIRAVADIKQVSTDTEQKTLALHGTAGQIEVAEWLFGVLDLPASGQEWATREYRPPSGGDDVVRVFYLTHTETVQNFAEVATVVRSIGNIRRLFTYYALRAVALRGTAEQIGLAEWLFHEFDQPAKNQDTSKHEYQVSAGGDDVVRVFYLPQTDSVQRFQEIATQVRSAAQIRRLFTYNAPRAIALRASPGQVAMADRLIKQQVQ